MVSYFEVIDLKSGNVIGGFDSQEDALASLRRALGAHGPRAIQNLSLMRITEDDQFLVAMEDDLERWVRGLESGVVRSAP
jgi:hypothetical protein